MEQYPDATKKMEPEPHYLVFTMKGKRTDHTSTHEAIPPYTYIKETK